MTTKLERFETLSKYRIAVLSIYKELGDSLNKHATYTNLARHVPKHDRVFVKDVVKVFIRTGLLRKHRTDTFSWTVEGLRYAKHLLENYC